MVKNDPQKRKQSRNKLLGSPGYYVLRAGGFSSCLDVFRGGLGINMLQFFEKILITIFDYQISGSGTGSGSGGSALKPIRIHKTGFRRETRSALTIIDPILTL